MLCSVSPSRALKPITKLQFCQRTQLPSTWKLGPSGCTISKGLMSRRVFFTRSAA
jgi:hypothetical protein